MSDLNTLRANVEAKVKDQSQKLTADDYLRIIAEAIIRYSKHRPLAIVADITGNGTKLYDLPASWIDEFSSVLLIEYPIGSIPAALIDPSDYEIYATPTGKKLRLLYLQPAVSDAFRVSYTSLRTETTIPSSDIEALCNLAASLCLEDLANLFLQTSDPTIQADVVNYRSKSQEAAARAKTLRNLYKEHMNLKDDDTVQPASAVSSLEQNYPGGADRLTHSRWSRRLR